MSTSSPNVPSPTATSRLAAMITRCGAIRSAMTPPEQEDQRRRDLRGEDVRQVGGRAVRQIQHGERDADHRE